MVELDGAFGFVFMERSRRERHRERHLVGFFGKNIMNGGLVVKGHQVKEEEVKVGETEVVGGEWYWRVAMVSYRERERECVYVFLIG